MAPSAPSITCRSILLCAFILQLIFLCNFAAADCGLQTSYLQGLDNCKGTSPNQANCCSDLKKTENAIAENNPGAYLAVITNPYQNAQCRTEYRTVLRNQSGVVVNVFNFCPDSNILPLITVNSSTTCPKYQLQDVLQIINITRLATNCSVESTACTTCLASVSYAAATLSGQSGDTTVVDDCRKVLIQFLFQQQSSVTSPSIVQIERSNVCTENISLLSPPPPAPPSPPPPPPNPPPSPKSPPLASVPPPTTPASSVPPPTTPASSVPPPTTPASSVPPPTTPASSVPPPTPLASQPPPTSATTPPPPTTPGSQPPPTSATTPPPPTTPGSQPPPTTATTPPPPTAPGSQPPPTTATTPPPPTTPGSQPPPTTSASPPPPGAAAVNSPPGAKSPPPPPSSSKKAATITGGTLFAILFLVNLIVF